MIMGPPASSGKSTVADPIAVRNRARVIDADEAKALLSEFDDGRVAGSVHDESAHLACDVLLEQTATRGESIVYPTVGKSEVSLLKTVELLRALGYDVHLIINEVPVLTSAKRA
jgi:predicted ABC-type ATPase